MKTEKDWEQFGRDLEEALAEAEKMTDEEWEAMIADIPEGPLFEDVDPAAVVAIGVKRRPDPKARAVRQQEGNASKKSH